MTGQVEEFSSSLAERGLEYQLVSRSGRGKVHIRFTGRFGGSPVIWDATICAQEFPRYIEVAENGYPVRRIAIGLNIAEIDHAAILRTMIMIRKYKRLHAGRHEFGNSNARTRGD